MNIKLETDRFYLREFEINDIQIFFELDSDPNVHKYLGNNPLKNIDEAQKMVEFIMKQYQDFGIGRWAVIDKSNNEFVGWSGLKYELNERTNEKYYDIGYRLKFKYWGKGIAQETANACLKHGFDSMKVDGIYASASVDNIASNVVLQKIGLKYIEQYNYQAKNENILCNWYGLSKEEYDLIDKNKN